MVSGKPFGNILEMSADVIANTSQPIFVNPISTLTNEGFLDAVGGEYNRSLDDCISPFNQCVPCVNEYMEPYGFGLVF